MPFILLFLVWPLLEILTFMAVGDEIGFFNTLFLAIGMVIAGIALVQVQGLKTMGTIQTALGQGKLPAAALFDQACLFLAGVLFILPGFLSDVPGLILLVPQLRHWLHPVAARFFTGQPLGPGGFRRQTAQDEIIDAEFVILEEEDVEPHDPDRPLLP